MNTKNSKLRATDGPFTYLLLCYKVHKKDGIPIEQVNGETIVSTEAYASFISRQEVQKRLKKLNERKVKKLRAEISINEIVSILWPEKKKRSKH